MKIGKSITGFYVSKAQYLVEGAKNKLLLNIDYYNNKYDICVVEDSIGVKKIRKEAEKIARDLLKRKSKVNFAVKN